MDKLTRSTAAIAEAYQPGWRAVEEVSLPKTSEDPLADTRGSHPESDAVMPSLDELQAKYLGAADAPPRPADEPARDDSDTVLVELASGPLRKTVAVSRTSKQVLWSQG